MSDEIIFDIEGNYKKYYPPIFSFFYLTQGIHQALPAILPYYLLFVFGEYNIALVAYIIFFAHLPWSIKFIVGLLNDRFGSERFGRRFPFILVFGSIGGVTWILTTFFLPLDKSIYSYLVGYLLVTNIGMAVADTSLDGLILDVVPKAKLAKVQGYTWTMLMLGNAAAAAIGLLFYWFGIVPLLFLITGITMVFCSILPYYIKEPPLKEEINIKSDIKRIVTETENFKVFGWTLITAMAYPIIVSSFFYYMLLTMGVIDVNQATLSLEAGQTTDAYIFLSILVSGANGLGVVIGSLLVSRITDKSRKKGINLIYTIYLPFCILSTLFVGLVFGLIAQIIFGFIYGSVTIVGQTIRGDIAKKNFPDLKSTYYALLISFSNLGQSLGNLILAFIFANIAPVIANFFIVYFIITLISSGIVLMSYLVFKTINPDDYEFQEGEKSDIEPPLGVCPICGGQIDEGMSFCADCEEEEKTPER